jgi:hypothetical protein
MRPGSILQRCRNATWKVWLCVAFAAWLLLAESFAIAHEYESAAHPNGQTCAVCVSAASFGAADVAAPTHFEPAIATSFVIVAPVVVFSSAVPTRRYARGPPVVSFTF